MTKLLSDGMGILFMKVGTHAREPLDLIIARKTKEIEDEGFAFWGYGGNTCHPSTMVQPFARSYEKKGSHVLLCMQEMESKHFAEQVRADEYSIDGIHWQQVPAGINVLGSRYALVIENLRKEEMTLPLSRTAVAVGNSQGRSGSRYIQGRVDKACLEFLSVAESGSSADGGDVKIGLLAELRSPYAVFLKNRI